jgi:uncharacterized membrane protein
MISDGTMGAIFSVCLAAVILGHFVFAIVQVFFWPWLCRRVTKLTDEEIESSRFLGRSIASYNASIGLGMALSLRLLENGSDRFWDGELLIPADGAFLSVQMAVMAFIAATALVGAMGTSGKTILIARFSPAAAAFLILAFG